MKDRCNNPNTPYYENYGGRGVTICERWQSFENFIEDMGQPPSDEHTLDKDVKGGVGCLLYSPENCSWQLRLNQNRNKSNVKLTMEKAREIRRLVAEGNTQTAVAKKFGVYDSCDDTYNDYAVGLSAKCPVLQYKLLEKQLS